MKEKISITLDKKTLDRVDSLIDNFFIKNRSQAIEHVINLSVGDQKTAVILCGGSEKLVELSKGVYRMTAIVDGKSVIEHAILKLRENGFTRIFITARAKVLTAIFGIIKDGSEHGVKVEYLEEKESVGTAHSLRYLKGKITSPFLVVYGDILFNRINITELWNAHLQSHYQVTLMMTTSRNPSTKGTIRAEGSKVLEFTQKPKTSDIYLVFSPLFVCDPELLSHKGDSLETDIFPELAQKGLLGGHLSAEKEKHIHTLKDIP